MFFKTIVNLVILGQLVQATVMDHQDLSIEFSVNDDDDVTAFARNVYLVDHPTDNPQEDYLVGMQFYKYNVEEYL